MHAMMGAHTLRPAVVLLAGLDGKPVTTYKDLFSVLDEHKVGDKVQVGLHICAGSDNGVDIRRRRQECSARAKLHSCRLQSLKCQWRVHTPLPSKASTFPGLMLCDPYAYGYHACVRQVEVLRNSRKMKLDITLGERQLGKAE
jgi:hypothetical protein